MAAETARRWYRRPRGIIGLSALALGMIAAIVFVVSPWPAALMIRALFEKAAVETVAEMQPYVPDNIDEQLDVSYGDAGADTSFDVFRPEGVSGPLPTVVWIHGGAWISGDKSNVDPYAR